MLCRGTYRLHYQFQLRVYDMYRSQASIATVLQPDRSWITVALTATVNKMKPDESDVASSL